MTNAKLSGAPAATQPPEEERRSRIRKTGAVQLVPLIPTLPWKRLTRARIRISALRCCEQHGHANADCRKAVDGGGEPEHLARFIKH